MAFLNAGAVKTFFIPRHEFCTRRRTAHRPLGGHGVEGWLVAAGRGGASGREDGAAFPRRLSRKHYVRRPTQSSGENSSLKRTPVHSSPAGLCLPPTSIVSPLFYDSLVFIFSERTNDRTSITGSTGSSPSGIGLHRLAYRRKRNRLTPRSKSFCDTAVAATDPRSRRKRTIPPAPWASLS